MKTFFIATAALACILGGASNANAQADKAKQLAQKYNCLACHAEDKKLVGPAYKEIAKKYKGDAGAAGKLHAKIKQGGGGVWGTIPMPPNNVPDAEIKTLVDWILAM